MSLAKDSALLVVDLITGFDFEDGDQLFKNTRPILKNIQNFKRACRDEGMPVIYVNDPTTKGRSMSREQLLDAVSDSERGGLMLDTIGPDDLDVVLVKPHRSGFFDTDLEQRLDLIGVKHVYIVGVTTDICILFTAHDAYMRELKVSVPADCVTAVQQKFHEDALEFMERVAEVTIIASYARVL